MERAWKLPGSSPELVILRSDLARGTTIWRNGQVVVDDASWSIEQEHRLPLEGGAVARVSIVRAWPFPTRAALTIGERALPPVEPPSGERGARRPIAWWGRLTSAVALASVLLVLATAPFAVLFSLACLRIARRPSPGPAQVALAVCSALAPWILGAALILAMALGLQRIVTEGGLGMIVLLILGPFAAALALAHAIQGHLRSGLRALVAIAAVAAIGTAFTHRDRAKVDEALLFANPADQATIREMGYAESAHARRFGLCFAGGAAVVAAVGELRRLRRRA